MNRERRDMVGNIILSFSTLAAAFRIKAPLPPYLPPAEESRRRLVGLYTICSRERLSHPCGFVAGRSYSEVGCSKKARSERFAATPVLCLCVDDERSDNGARHSWPNTARCIWGNRSVDGRFRDAFLTYTTYCIIFCFTLTLPFNLRRTSHQIVREFEPLSH